MMKGSKLLPLAMISVSALMFNACGAKQGGKHRLSPTWDNAMATIPADAAFAGAMDYARLGEDRMSGNLASFEAISAMFLNGSVGDVTASVGIDERGDVATFLRGDAFWVIVKVKDPGATFQALQQLFADNGELETRRIGDRPVLRGIFETGSTNTILDAAVLDRYMVLRASGEISTELVDAELRQMADGWPGVGVMVNAASTAHLLGRAGDRPVVSFGTVSTKGINASLAALHENPEGLLGVLRNVFAFGYGELDVDQAQCDELNRRIETVFPSISSVGYTLPDGTLKSASYAPLSGRPLERARAILRGGPALAQVVANGILGLGVSFDYNTFLSGLQATPAHKSCVGLAGIAGTLADLNESSGPRIRFNARTVSGTFGLVLESVDLNGLVPTAAGAVVIHSPNPTALMDRILRSLEPMGTATVDARASMPSVNVQLTMAPLNVRVQTGEDRVVVNVGRLSEATTTALHAVPLLAPNGAFLSTSINGERAKQLGQDVENYLEEMEIMTPDLRIQLERVTNQFDGARDIETEMRVTPNGLEGASRK